VSKAVEFLFLKFVQNSISQLKARTKNNIPLMAPFRNSGGLFNVKNRISNVEGIKNIFTAC